MEREGFFSAANKQIRDMAQNNFASLSERARFIVIILYVKWIVIFLVENIFGEYIVSKFSLYDLLSAYQSIIGVDRNV